MCPTAEEAGAWWCVLPTGDEAGAWRCALPTGDEAGAWWCVLPTGDEAGASWGSQARWFCPRGDGLLTGRWYLTNHSLG